MYYKQKPIQAHRNSSDLLVHLSKLIFIWVGQTIQSVGTDLHQTTQKRPAYLWLKQYSTLYKNLLLDPTSLFLVNKALKLNDYLIKKWYIYGLVMKSFVFKRVSKHK